MAASHSSSDLGLTEGQGRSEGPSGTASEIASGTSFHGRMTFQLVRFVSDIVEREAIHKAETADAAGDQR